MTEALTAQPRIRYKEIVLGGEHDDIPVAVSRVGHIKSFYILEQLFTNQQGEEIWKRVEVDCADLKENKE